MAENHNTSTRVWLFDNVKFILILFVVVGHFIDYKTDDIPFYRSLFVFISSFHMPLFIYISGIFHKYKDTLQKVIKYILIALIYNAAIFLLERFLLGETNAQFELLSTSKAPWFMIALATLEVLTYIFRNINKKYLIIICFFVALFAGYNKNIGDTLCLSRIIVFYPFYLLGTITDSNIILNLNKSKRNKIIGAVILAAFFAICCIWPDTVNPLRHFFTGRNPYSGVFSENGILIRMLCYIITFAASFSVLCIMPQKKIGIMTKIGSRTLQIYFWHRILLYVMVGVGILQMFNINIFGPILYIICAIALTFLCSLKIFSFPTANIMNANFKKQAESKTDK